MLAPALRRNVCDRSFEHFQERLLNAFAGNVAGDRDVLARFADFVDFVDVNNPALRQFDVEVGGAQEFQNEVFDVFADVAGFGQRRRVPDGERNVQHPSERLREERLPGAGRAEKQNVRLADFDVVEIVLRHNPLVMIVNRDRERPFRQILPDDVIVQLRDDFARRRNASERRAFALAAFAFLR